MLHTTLVYSPTIPIAVLAPFALQMIFCGSWMGRLGRAQQNLH